MPKRNIIKEVKVPKKLVGTIDSKVEEEFIEKAFLFTDFSGTLISQSANVVLGLEMLKYYFDKKDYSIFLKKLCSLSVNFFNYKFRENFNLKSQKLKTIYSVFNGLEKTVFDKAAEKMSLNPNFVNIISCIRKENSLNDNDYISLSILTRDLKKVAESFILNKKNALEKMKVHIPKQQIYANKFLYKGPSIYVKTITKQKYLDKLQEKNPSKNLVYITDREKIREFNQVKYVIRL